MISIGPSTEEFSKNLLDKPGGFLWWYLDLIDEHGNGAVCIWAYGLPFLPGLASSARNNTPILAGSRPSWTLSVFEGGKEAFYLLSEYDQQDCSWDPERGEWRFGETIFRSVIDENRIKLEIKFSTTAPGFPGKLTGSLSAEGPLRQCRPDQVRASDHSWEPLTLGSAYGELNIQCGDFESAINGRAYYDRNAGDKPLHELGIQDWFWGRFSFPDHEVVVYLLNGENGHNENYLLSVDKAGRLSQRINATVHYKHWRISRFGSSYPRTLLIDFDEDEQLSITLQPPMDDSPFYRRFVSRCTHDNQTAIGVFEHVVPGKIDPNWMRPLVRMRTHRVSQSNSIWLPLFSGPKVGRWARLVRSWFKPKAITTNR